MVVYYTIPVYSCRCDVCGKFEQIYGYNSNKIYNGAQAVRSLGWSFGKDGKTVKCDNCRTKRTKRM